MSSEANNDTANTPDSVLSAREAPPSVDTTAEEAAETAAASLPSVIVDASLHATADTVADTAPPSMVVDSAASAAPTTEPAAAIEPASADISATQAPSDDNGSWSVGAFSEHDADRFADSMRPSWDMPPEAEGNWSAARATPVPQNTRHVPTGRAVAASNDSDGLPPVVIARGIDRRMALAGGGGVVLIVLALWSMIGGEPEVPPPSWNGATPSTQAAPTPSKAPPANAAVDPASAAAETSPTPPAPLPVAPPTPAPTTPTPPTATAPATAAPAVPSEPATVHVRISTTPAGAELKLDGEFIPNPFDAWVNRGGTHNVVADADGYAQRGWSIAFDQDQTLSLVLKREEAKRPARRVRRPQPRSTPSKSRPRGAGFVTDNPY